MSPSRPMPLFFGRIALLAFALAGCGTQSTSRPTPIGPVPGVVDNEIGGSCVLYARAASGIDLRGDAYSWWDLAAGRYLRGNMPEVGAVLVLTQTERLHLGHLAVVRQVIDT